MIRYVYIIVYCTSVCWYRSIAYDAVTTTRLYVVMRGYVITVYVKGLLPSLYACTTETVQECVLVTR
jgi:hypothetical protein